MENLIQPVVNGILLGGLYAAVAVGLSMMFGIVRFINLAHGDLMIVASYMALVITERAGLSPFPTLIVVVPSMFIIGFLLQKYLLNRALITGPEPPIIVALGISVVIQNALLLVFTPDAQAMSTELSILSIRVSEHVTLPAIYLTGFLVGCGVIGVVHAFVKWTFLGKAIRAASDDAEAAQLMGVDTEHVYCYAMGVAMVTAAVAGILVGTTFTFYPHSGPQYLLIAFGVVIIGGVGSVVGTLIGGIALGLAQLLGAHFFGPGYQLLCGYLVMLAILTIRPAGFFGRANL
jgi:branched-chain amino acid transport system permease protein